MGCQIGRALWDHLILTPASLFFIYGETEAQRLLDTERRPRGVVPGSRAPNQVRVKSVLHPPFLAGCEPVTSLGQPYLPVAFPFVSPSDTPLSSSSPML